MFDQSTQLRSMESLHCRRQALMWHESGKVMGRKAGCAGCLIHQQSQEGSVSIHDFCFDLAQLEILRWSLQNNHKFVRLLSRMSRHRKTCTNLENQKTLWLGGQRTSVPWIRFGLWKLCGISSHWRPFPWPCRNFLVYHVDRHTRRKTHQYCHWSRLSGFMSQNPVVATLPFFYSKIFERRVPRFERGMTSWIKSTARSAPPESRISSANACAFQRKALLLVPRSSSSGNGNQWKSMGSITSNQHEWNNSRV